jgi:hypothetical protein
MMHLNHAEAYRNFVTDPSCMHLDVLCVHVCVCAMYPCAYSCAVMFACFHGSIRVCLYACMCIGACVVSLSVYVSKRSMCHHACTAMYLSLLRIWKCAAIAAMSVLRIGVVCDLIGECKCRSAPPNTGGHTSNGGGNSLHPQCKDEDMRCVPALPVLAERGLPRGKARKRTLDHLTRVGGDPYPVSQGYVTLPFLGILC